MEDLILKALQSLSNVCDGAKELDGHGFNGGDAYFGNQLAARSELTPKQRYAAYKMLRKYTKQLAAYGIDYAAIEAPSKPEDIQKHLKDSGILKTPSSPNLITLDGDNIFIQFAFDYDMLAKVKALPLRRFSKEPKIGWTVPVNAASAEAIAQFLESEKDNFWIESDSITQKVNDVIADKIISLEESFAADSDIEINGLGGELRPFQKAGVAYAVKKKRVLIGDEMGLGKTVQALATLHQANAFPALIICPASLKYNWERETQKWLPNRSVNVLNGKNSYVGNQDITIINYDIVNKNLDDLKLIQWQGIVLDESHYLKNYKAKRTESVKELAKDVPYRIALSGTAILNRPQELLSQLIILDQINAVGGFWNFRNNYCLGAGDLEQLNTSLRESCYIRRNKFEVLKELPPKQISEIYVDIDNRAEYNKAKADLSDYIRSKVTSDEKFIESIADLEDDDKQNAIEYKIAERVNTSNNVEHLARIEALKQLAAKGKLQAAKDWIENFLESDQKLVVFASHIEIQKDLIAAFPGCAQVLGGDKVIDRQANVDRFQNDPDCKLIVCSLVAAGVGITLTAASNVLTIELGWTPALHAQAFDRCHRMGQKDSVNCYYLLANDTIDNNIYKLLKSKEEVVSATIEGKKAEGKNLFKQLIKDVFL